mmetsp:Transcript_2023/g.4224  ORF Transcript_2023/g.4224 Transcript_2023/m.4224 type:complete len:92 (+) Transcript_2023:184-459(+)|eukprot:2928762-Pleurochrysis_carterae.AAC.4
MSACNAEEGVLITCDAPIKQFILYTDEEGRKKGSKESFVLHDLDETHLLVRKGSVPAIQAALEELQDSNAFSRVDLSGSSQPAKKGPGGKK